MARFSYRAALPAHPAALRVARSRRGLEVRWRRSPGAARYQVTATARSGRVLLMTSWTRARFSGLEYFLRGTVRVTPLRGAGARGPSARGRFAAARG